MDRLQDCRRYRDEARRRQDRHAPRASRHLLCVDRGNGRRARGLPTNELVPLAEKLLEIPQDLIRTALDLELAEGTIIADQVDEINCIFQLPCPSAERRRPRAASLSAALWQWAGLYSPPNHRNRYGMIAVMDSAMARSAVVVLPLKTAAAIMRAAWKAKRGSEGAGAGCH
jgi:hypothetical protein